MRPVFFKEGGAITISSKITDSLDIFYRLAVKPLKTYLDARAVSTSFTLPASGWTENTDESSGYKFYYDLTAASITANDIVKCIIDYQSQETAAACGLCPNCWTSSGTIRFRAKGQPASAINGVWRVD